MSIKTKMQSLIEAANAETGKGDTDLTTAVQSLISESGGITPSGNKAVTPSETAQSGIDVTNFKTVSVDAISSTYVGSGVTKKAAATVAPSTSEQTVCASGVYTTGEQKVSAITPSIVGNLDASSFAASIVAAIEGKGVDVPSGAKLDALAALIESIQAGGGGGTGYNFDGNPRWVSSGEFTVSETVTVSTIEPILFNPEVMDGNQLDWNRGRFFLLFDATKTNTPYTYSSPPGKNVNGVVAIINYAYTYSTQYPNSEYTAYLYASGSYLQVEREYGHSTYDQISFASTSRKFISGHRYCWVAWGMKAGNEA